MKITINKEKVVTIEEDIIIPNVINNHHPHFNYFLDYLKSLEFINGSHFSDLASYLGPLQGGDNSVSIKYIELLYYKDSRDNPLGKITVRVSWMDNYHPEKCAILIFRK
jgi:hypothetical protein